jgi:hypothetical protein
MLSCVGTLLERETVEQSEMRSAFLHSVGAVDRSTFTFGGYSKSTFQTPMSKKFIAG